MYTAVSFFQTHVNMTNRLILINLTVRKVSDLYTDQTYVKYYFHNTNFILESLQYWLRGIEKYKSNWSRIVSIECQHLSLWFFHKIGLGNRPVVRLIYMPVPVIKLYTYTDIVKCVCCALLCTSLFYQKNCMKKKKPSMQNVFQMSMFCLLPPSLCNMSELHEPQKNVDEKKNSIYQMCALKSKREQKEKK